MTKRPFQYQGRPEPLFFVALILLALLIPFWSHAIGQDRATNGKGAPSRVREGTKIKGDRGIFHIGVDRVEYESVSGLPRMQVLENITLERIVNDSSAEARIQWQVDGLVTEYQGRNYILIEKAFVAASEAE